MKRLGHAVTLTGVCGLVLFGSGIAQAQTTTPTNPPGSLLGAVVGADLGTVTEMVSGVVCNNRLVEYNYNSPRNHSPHPCINGPVDSGNSVDSNNFLNHGNPVDSGNIKSAAGSTNALNEVNGPRSNSSNDTSLGHPVFP
ncbi:MULTISPECIES: hypothetical protein [Streptomyces]|uniref:hypothetical protein n=1 Tax=Streptomyces TaxID=1883 RepID=UPI0019A764C2|nr:MULTISPECIES: hypothetical protein [Streptomyces]MCC2278102.1 hypothetical protein [Streptomyces sp. ET3-23]GHF21187.1 hypothetical protein GCM10010359_23220 [Streptomyces morookaense]